MADTEADYMINIKHDNIEDLEAEQGDHPKRVSILC